MNIKKIFAICLCLGVVVSAFAACGGKTESFTSSLTNPTTENAAASKIIAVYADNLTDVYAEQVKRGAQSAADENGYELRFFSGSYENDAVKDALETDLEKYAAAAVSSDRDDFNKVFEKAFEKNLPIVYFGNITDSVKKTVDSKDKNPVKSVVRVADKQLGETAAQYIFEAVKDDITKAEGEYILGVLSGVKTDAHDEMRKAFEDKFNELAAKDAQTKDKVKIEFEANPDADAVWTDSYEKLAEKKCSAVFVTDEKGVAEIADTVAAKPEDFENIKFFGAGAGSKQVNWYKAENSRIFGSLVTDGFEVGREIVTQCVNAAEGRTVEPMPEISLYWYDPSNIDKMLEDKIVYEG